VEGAARPPYGPIESVARISALVESATRIAFPTADAPGIPDFASAVSRWRSVRVSRDWRAVRFPAPLQARATGISTSKICGFTVLSRRPAVSAPRNCLPYAGSPFRTTPSTISANRSTSPTNVYTFGVTRMHLNSGWLMGVTMMRCFCHR
jgi:hypothetical protein